MCNIQLDVTHSNEIEAACKLLARHYYGKRGVLAYESFDHINSTFFGGQLPTPNIQWLLTPYGHCLGLTGIKESLSVPPSVVLHTALLGDGAANNPWGIDQRCLGVRYAYEVLLHECIHISVHYLLGGYTGPTSHNSPEWIDEVNRIAPMIGLGDVVVAMSKSKRVPVDGEYSKTGKPATTVQRVTGGNVPFKAVATFPHGVRDFLHDMSIYEENALPFVCSVHDNNRGR